MTAQDLQNAVLLVLGLLASLALVNAPAEFAALGQHWRNLLEFLVSGVLLL